MENKSSNGWKFFALLFGALLAAVVGLYIYKQQNPDYDPWEEPWENSSSPSRKPRPKPLIRKPPDRFPTIDSFRSASMLDVDLFYARPRPFVRFWRIGQL